MQQKCTYSDYDQDGNSPELTLCTVQMVALEPRVNSAP